VVATAPLGDLCGPHCGTKDGRTAHCPACHRLAEMPLSGDKVRLTEQHQRGERR
jgi:hypothetical protein